MPLRYICPAWPKCLAFDGFRAQIASSLAQRRVLLQNMAFLHNFGELPIRRPNRAPPAATKDGPRTNDESRNAQIQLIDQNGTNHGTIETVVAIKMALDPGIDPVERGADIEPPLCRIMD